MFKSIRIIQILSHRNLIYKYSTMAQGAGAGDGLLQDITGMRTKYHGKEETFLEENLVAKEPIGLFKSWFSQACEVPGIIEANAMCLATATKDGLPSARFVLLKSYGKEGFKFFTNYNSRKAHDLEENPRAALTFYWEPLHRSIRIEGKVNKIPEAESDEYFKTRPYDSQIGSSVSNQSTVIKSRNILLEKELELKQRYKDKEVPRPKHWGGYVLVPEMVEFWSGQSDRLHDRIVFRKKNSREVINKLLTHEGEDGWVYERLSP